MRTFVAVVLALGLAACSDNENPGGGQVCDANNPCPTGFTCVITGGQGICLRIPDAGGADGPRGDAGPPPDTTIVTSPDSVTSNTTATFTFTSTPAGATFECNLDGTGFTACTTPRMLTGLTDGTHVFAVRAVLNGATDPTPDTRTWRVDTSAPTVQNLVCPAAQVAASEVSISFSSEQGATFSCTLDGTAATCTSPAHYGSLALGAHAFTVVAIDTAGNRSAASPCNFTVTAASPETTIDCPALPQSTTTVSVGFTSTPAGATFECAVNEGAFAACTSPDMLTGLAEGTTHLHVRATQGGVSEPVPADCDIVVDTHAPTVTIDSGPQNGDVTGTTVTFTYHSDEANSTFVCTLGDATGPCLATGITYPNLAAGAQHFSIVAKDLAGNASAPATRDFMVGGGPSVVITLVPEHGPQDGLNGVVGPNGSIQFTTTTGDTGIVYSNCTLDGTAVTPCTSPVPWAALADGTTHEFDVTATNSSSTLSTTAKRGFTVDAAGPTIVILAPNDVTGTDFFASFTATDTSAPVTTSCAIDGSPVGCSSGVPFEVVATSGTLIITATDVFGNSKSARKDLQIDSTGPDIIVDKQPRVSCPSSSDADLDDSFNFHSSDTGPVRFSCSIDGLGTSDCTIATSVGLERWDDLADGNHTIVITAFDEFGNPGPVTKDPNGNVTQTGLHITWIVDREPPSLTIQNPVDQNTPTGVSGTISLKADDRPAGSGHAVVILGCKIDDTIDCDDTGADPVGDIYTRFGWHGLADGAHHVNITAQDFCGPVNVLPGGVTNTWTVDDHGPAVTFTSFTGTNTSPAGGGPTGVTTQGAGTVNWTLRDPRSNPTNNTHVQAQPVNTTCTITPIGVTNGGCSCTAAPVAGGHLPGEDWNCHANFTSAADVIGATIVLNYHDDVVPANPSTPPNASLTWNIDATAPTIIPDPNAPQVGSCVTAAGVRVSAGAGNIPFTSSDTPTTASFNCSLADLTTPGTPVSGACTSLGGTSYNYGFSNLVNAHHYQLTITATDEVGNQRTAQRDWFVDSIAPTVTFNTPATGTGLTNVVSQPDANGVGTDTTTSITITETGAVAATAPTVTCTVDSNAVTCNSTSFSLAGLANGAHTVVVTPTDCVGNSPAPGTNSLAFRLDKDDPVVTVPSPPTTVVSAAGAVNVTATLSDSTTLSSFQCSLDSAAGFTPCPLAQPLPTGLLAGSVSSTIALTELSAGQHQLRYRALDAFNHPSVTGNILFTVDFDGLNTGAFGHIILLGQDFSTAENNSEGTTSLTRLIGNTARISNASSFGRPLNIYIADFDPAGSPEAANVEAAICARLQDFDECGCGAAPTCATFTTANLSAATTAAAFQTAIRGQDVIVFADLDTTNGTTIGNSTGWTDLVNSTANLGTVYIATNGGHVNPVTGNVAWIVNTTYGLLGGTIAGLQPAFLAPPWSDEVDSCTSDDPLTVDVNTFDAPNDPASFDFDDADAAEFMSAVRNSESVAAAAIDKPMPATQQICLFKR